MFTSLQLCNTTPKTMWPWFSLVYRNHLVHTHTDITAVTHGTLCIITSCRALDLLVLYTALISWICLLFLEHRISIIASSSVPIPCNKENHPYSLNITFFLKQPTASFMLKTMILICRTKVKVIKDKKDMEFFIHVTLTWTHSNEF